MTSTGQDTKGSLGLNTAGRVGDLTVEQAGGAWRQHQRSPKLATMVITLIIPVSIQGVVG